MPQYTCDTFFKDKTLHITAKNRTEAIKKRNKILNKIKVTRLIDRSKTEVTRRT